ncbi:restriction endonuclease subunit S [Enterobacter bugandensis]|uniref:restriction endonuclease subunit S n=2 Tax=Enterobacter TaxID=547 RepID=UPI0023AF46C8|nr:restriction endonuclease subunit S [Enterobacter bugandensis]MDE7592021.1 restriction endonuclease subunit S [Enterobacter bugandensis]
MSELSYLEKLLDGVKVEWLPLASLCALITTGKLNANAMDDKGKYPFFTCNEQPYKINTYAFDLEAIIISGNGSQVGHLNYYKGKFNAYQRTYIVGDFNSNVNIMYLYYYLIHTLKPYIHKNSRKGSVPYITMPMLENFIFPIPCPDNPEKSLAIQSEIVRILDTFTALTAELTAVLSMRKNQYNYYRDQLLSFEEDEVEWKNLGAVVEINTGQKPSEILDNPTTFDYINAGTTRSGYTTVSNCDGDTVTTPSRGQGGIGFVGYQQGPFWLGPLCYKMRAIDKRILINKFLFYFLQSRSELLLNLKKEGGVPAVNKSDLATLAIPLPPLDEQNRIVAILDKFYILTNSITEGLPREIELRQKQYEYYRDMLFSFPKPEVAEA